MAHFIKRVTALTLGVIRHYVALTVLGFRILIHNMHLRSEFLFDSLLGCYGALKHLTAKAAAIVQSMVQYCEDSYHYFNRTIQNISIGIDNMDALTVASKLMDLTRAWNAYSLRVNIYCIKAFLRTTRYLETALLEKGAFIRSTVEPGLRAAFHTLRRRVSLVQSFCVESYQDWLHYYYSSITPELITAIQAMLILTFLYCFRHRIKKLWYRYREAPEVLASALYHSASPLSILHTNQLAMIFRKPIPGAYVHDPTNAFFERWPAAYHFVSTLQLPPLATPPTISSLPPAVRHRILTLATTTASSFVFHPHTHSLRLRTPCIAFHRAWRLARALGHRLPGNTIELDACVGPSLSIPSGREQLLDMLALLALPKVATASRRTLWMERVAESMASGEPWVVVVREAWRRVWAFDLGIMVGAFLKEGAVAEGVRVEYRIVMYGLGDVVRVVEMVRQLEEAASLGYRDERFKVVVEGWKTWEWVNGAEEYGGRRVVDLVEAAVEKMNVVG